MKKKDQNTQKNVGVTIVLLNKLTAFYCIKLFYSYYNFTLPILNEPIACSFNIEEIQCFFRCDLEVMSFGKCPSPENIQPNNVFTGKK